MSHSESLIDGLRKIEEQASSREETDASLRRMLTMRIVVLATKLGLFVAAPRIADVIIRVQKLQATSLSNGDVLSSQLQTTPGYEGSYRLLPTEYPITATGADASIKLTPPVGTDQVYRATADSQWPIAADLHIGRTVVRYELPHDPKRPIEVAADAMSSGQAKAIAEADLHGIDVRVSRLPRRYVTSATMPTKRSRLPDEAQLVRRPGANDEMPALMTLSREEDQHRRRFWRLRLSSSTIPMGAFVVVYWEYLTAHSPKDSVLHPSGLISWDDAMAIWKAQDSQPSPFIEGVVPLSRVFGWRQGALANRSPEAGRLTLPGQVPPPDVPDAVQDQPLIAVSAFIPVTEYRRRTPFFRHVAAAVKAEQMARKTRTTWLMSKRRPPAIRIEADINHRQVIVPFVSAKDWAHLRDTEEDVELAWRTWRDRERPPRVSYKVPSDANADGQLVVAGDGVESFRHEINPTTWILLKRVMRRGVMARDEFHLLWAALGGTPTSILRGGVPLRELPALREKITKVPSDRRLTVARKSAIEPDDLAPDDFAPLVWMSDFLPLDFHYRLPELEHALAVCSCPADRDEEITSCVLVDGSSVTSYHRWDLDKQVIIADPEYPPPTGRSCDEPDRWEFKPLDTDGGECTVYWHGNTATYSIKHSHWLELKLSPEPWDTWWGFGLSEKK